MSRLQQRPVLFKCVTFCSHFYLLSSLYFLNISFKVSTFSTCFVRYVIDEYCVSRRAVLVGQFIDALTRGGPSGNPAPIEMRAHDPQIYITDILVWINKAIPVERQNLYLLVKLCDNTGKTFTKPQN